MAITTLDGLLAAPKQIVTINKTNTITTTAANPFTIFDRAGIPAAGALSPSNTTTGVVPTDATTGCPAITNFNGSNKGYISNVMASTNVATGLRVMDLLFWAGPTTIPTASNTTVTLSSQPSYSGRLPLNAAGTTDWTQAELWLLSSVAWSNHAHSTTVTYVDDAGNTAEASANVSTQNLGVNRLLRVPLNSSDRGVRQINSYTVNFIASASGSVTVLVARTLFAVRLVPGFNQFSADQIGMPEVFGDSALFPVVMTDSTTSPTLDLQLTIAEG